MLITDDMLTKISRTLAVVYIGTFHLRGLALQLSGKNPSFALQNAFHLRRFFT